MRRSGAVNAVETTRGRIAARKVAVVAAGHTSVVMAMAGVRMPLESYPLQALVSEPVKPVLPCVVMSNSIHAYISQSDKGELVIGAATDAYVSYSQAGGLHIAEHTLEAICELFPTFRRLRMLRNWGGIVDVTPGSLADHRTDAGAGALCELRLGYRRLQGHARIGPRIRRDDRTRRTASDRRSVLARSVPHRPADRRGRRRRGGALMLLIACPWCGMRPENEFHYGGEAHIARPADPASVDDAAWAEFLYMRSNPKGMHAERWRHIHGCGRFFNCVRDTVSDRISATYKPGEPPSP